MAVATPTQFSEFRASASQADDMPTRSKAAIRIPLSIWDDSTKKPRQILAGLLLFPFPLDRCRAMFSHTLHNVDYGQCLQRPATIDRNHLDFLLVAFSSLQFLFNQMFAHYLTRSTVTGTGRQIVLQTGEWLSAKASSSSSSSSLQSAEMSILIRISS
jgi:hypothetical protein